MKRQEHASNVILFDGDIRNNLLPLSFCRPIADFRIGILTIKEKWQRILPGHYSFLTQPYLSEKYPVRMQTDNYFIAGNICPTLLLSAEVANLKNGEALMAKDRLLAFHGTQEQFESSSFLQVTETDSQVVFIDTISDIFVHNHQAIEEDFRLITENRISCKIHSNVRIIGDPYYPDGTPKIFIEDGVKMECTILNVNEGPIYIGKEVIIEENSIIRGPFAACEKAVVRSNSSIYGATTIGPYCQVGGEINNVVLFGYSNKAHDGLLAHSVIGEWCSIGAGTNICVQKNDYSELKLWNYPQGRFIKTGLPYCGLIMADYSKIGINCMLDAATILGVGVFISGGGFPRIFVPSFSEGGSTGFSDLTVSKFLKYASFAMSQKGIALTETDQKIFEYIATQAENFK